jgi:hypothetical protein
VVERYPFNAALIRTLLLRGDKTEMAKHLDRIRDEARAVSAPAAAR